MAKATINASITFAPGSSVLLHRPSVQVGGSVSVFNGMLQSRTEAVSVTLDGYSGSELMEVVNPSGVVVTSVVVPPVPGEFNFPPSPNTAFQLVFLADLPPLSSTVFSIRKASNGNQSLLAVTGNWSCAAPGIGLSGDVTLSGILVDVVFSQSTGLMTGITALENGKPVAITVQQQFLQYHSLKGSNAYQFAPNRSIFPFGESLPGGLTLCTFSSGFVHRAVQTYGAPSVLRETVTVYDGITPAVAAVETATEFRMATKDRELVTRYHTSIDNTVVEHPSDQPPGVKAPLPVLETDSNGYLMMRRVTNKTGWQRDEKYFYVSMAVAGNYYPLSGTPGAVRIGGQTAGAVGALAILTDTAHGTASLNKGWLEVMLGRRCDEDDSISVDDTDNITATNWLLPGSSLSVVSVAQRLLAKQLSTPVLPLAVATDTRPMWSAGAETSPNPVPASIHMLSLDRVGVDTTAIAIGQQVLLRLLHVMQAGESTEPLASPVHLTLRDLLAPAGVIIQQANEVLLNGLGEPRQVDLDAVLVFNPLQIRTFVVTLAATAE